MKVLVCQDMQHALSEHDHRDSMYHHIRALKSQFACLGSQGKNWDLGISLDLKFGS